MSVCCYPLLETTHPGGLETSGQRAYLLFWLNSRRLYYQKVRMIFCTLLFWSFWSLGTSILLGVWVFALCIVGELAGGLSLAVAVGVIDR